MNLLRRLKKEIAFLGLTDKYEIAYYIYIRMGELFEYDAYYKFASREEQLSMKFVEYNKEKIEKRKIICFSWALLYREILQAFGIEAWYRGSENHAYVIFYIDNIEYYADITDDFADISFIKFGFPVKSIGSHEALVNNEEINKKINYYHRINPLEVIDMVVKELSERYGDGELYRFQVMKFIENYLKFNHCDAGFESGIKLIDELLDIMAGTIIFKGQYYNLVKDRYMAIYPMWLDGALYYFVYANINGRGYRLFEASDDLIEELLGDYKVDRDSRFCFKKRKNMGARWELFFFFLENCVNITYNKFIDN